MSCPKRTIDLLVQRYSTKMSLSFRRSRSCFSPKIAVLIRTEFFYTCVGISTADRAARSARARITRRVKRLENSSRERKQRDTDDDVVGNERCRWETPSFRIFWRRESSVLEFFKFSRPFLSPFRPRMKA